MTANHQLASALVMDSGEPLFNFTFIKRLLNHPETCHPHMVPHNNAFLHYKQN